MPVRLTPLHSLILFHANEPGEDFGFPWDTMLVWLNCLDLPFQYRIPLTPESLNESLFFPLYKRL